MSDYAVNRREHTYPPPYPDGWYRVEASRDIRPGEVRYVECVGEQIALFRSTTDGEVAAVEAFCPHQGANLADGVVKGDRLQCPFHGWQLDGHGRIRSHPCADVQPLAHRHWEAIDYYGMIMMYRSARPGAQAPYRLPPLPEIDNRQLVLRGQYDAGDVDMHIIEFAENSVDFQHFSELHGVMHIPWTNISLPWIRIRHRPSWSLDDTQEHVSYFGDEATLEIGGRIIDRSRSRALITFLGPGSIVKFDFSVPRVGDITMFQSHTPVEALKQRVTFRWFAARRAPRILVSYVVGNWISQWRQDIAIWQRKIYRPRPSRPMDDGRRGTMHKWYRQFYPDGPVPNLTEGNDDGS